MRNEDNIFYVRIFDSLKSKSYCQILHNVIDIITSVGLSKEAALEKYGKVPDLGITFKVEKVYIQTPGPEAGKEITNSKTS